MIICSHASLNQIPSLSVLHYLRTVFFFYCFPFWFYVQRQRPNKSWQMEDYSRWRSDEDWLIPTFLPWRLLCTTDKLYYIYFHKLVILLLLFIFIITYGKSKAFCCQICTFIIAVFFFYQILLFHVYIQFVLCHVFVSFFTFTYTTGYSVGSRWWCQRK